MNWLKGYDAWKLASPFDDEPDYSGFEVEYAFDELPLRCGEASPLMVNGKATLIGDSNTFYAAHVVLDSFFGNDETDLDKLKDQPFWAKLDEMICDALTESDYVQEWFASEHGDWCQDMAAAAADYKYDQWKERDL